MSSVAIASGSQVLANVIWDDVVIAPLPWFLGRIVRARAAAHAGIT